MSGLIDEIQRSCLDEKVPVEALLRRVKLAAAKLKLGSLESWVEHELNGYDKDLPPHRILRGEPAALNSVHGWIPVQTSSNEMDEVLSTALVVQGIGSLRDLVSGPDSGMLHFSVPSELVRLINQNRVHKTARIVVQIPRAGIVGLIDHVRSMVLDWTIEMERNGVQGEGFSFNEKEVESAKQAMNTFNIKKIENFAGNMGVGNTAGDISLSSTNFAAIKDEMIKLRNAAPSLVDAGASSNLGDIIDAAIVETEQPEPDKGRLGVLVQDARSALVGAAGNLTAEGALAVIANVLRMLSGG